MWHMPRHWACESVRKNVEDVERPRSEIEAIIHQWVIGRNAERDARILIRSLLDGVRYEPLAEEFDLSVSQIKRIIDKRFNRVAKHL